MSSEAGSRERNLAYMAEARARMEADVAAVDEDRRERLQAVIDQAVAIPGEVMTPEEAITAMRAFEEEAGSK